MALKKGISLKVRVKAAGLEFELTHVDAAAPYISHYATGIYPPPLK